MDEHIHCAHSSSIRSEMQTALLGYAGFPPPTSGALVFARFRGAAAGRATDARIAFRVQGMTRHIVLDGIGFHIFAGPIRQRADLGPSVFL